MDENNDELKGGGKGELPEENDGDGKAECAEPVIQSKDGKAEHAESISQSKDGKVQNAESLSQSKDATVKKAENIQKATGPPKRKRTYKKSKTSGVSKLRGGFRSFGATVKKLWDVWGRFKTKNMQDPRPPGSEKTLGVPGFEEIACIEAEVPDIMMTDKDRVRTSCKECMQDPPTFPSKDQIKAKLIAADKYYGVKRAQIKTEQSDTILEHEADYYDVDGTVVRPSWRFILERPLVEQYVLMTNYIRKVSVLSELKEDTHSKRYIEEEESIDDTEYKRFEQKFIKDKRELLKPILKPKTQDMAVQTSFEPKQQSGEDLKESVSEISLYPESEESTNSPEASAVTIVTSRDYTSPLQSDFDGKTTDKSTSNRGGNWWESEATCQPSESFQTSYDSINKNTSSGSDGQSVPIHSTWGKTTLQPARGAFSNESDSRITPRSYSVEPATHRKIKDSKKVSFSPVVTYYQGPNKNGAVYNLPDEETAMETNQIETQQQGTAENPPLQNTETDNSPENRITDETQKSQEDIPNSIAAEKPKPSNKKLILGNILQDQKPGQIVSVSLPDDWSENRILRNNRMMKVVVSRPPAGKQPVSKRISFQEYDEIPDVEYSDSQVSTVRDRTDANIQTQTPVAPKRTPSEKCKPSKHRELSPHKHSFDYQAPRNPRPPKIQPVDENPSTAQGSNFSTPVTPHIPNTRILNADLNHSRWLGHEKTENIATETNTQSPPPRLSASPTSETLRRVEQKFDDKLVSPDRPRAPCTAVQHVKFPKTNTQTQVPQTGNIPKYDPRLKDIGDKYSRNVTDVNVHPSSNPDPVPVNHIPRVSHSPQHQSTDTEGPSSSSNEHIKLKASPACFFKVATPTDLSKISVDEFYPDVPEIDAELSQINETEISSAPCVEIVFANKETALRCMQDAEFSRVSRKQENTLLQRSIENGDDCPVRLNSPNKGNTITASAGVRIKIDEEQSKSSNAIVSKSSTRNSSQQSSITQSLGKSRVTARSMRESDENPIPPIEAQTTICETDLGSTETKKATIKGNEVNRTVKPTTNQLPALPIPVNLQNDKDMVSRQKVKVSPVATMEIKSNAPTSRDGTDHQGDSSKKAEETPSYKEVVNDTTKIDTVQREIEKRGRIEKLEQLANDDDDEDDDTLITLIQRQVESLPIDPADQAMSHGRTKLYMRTLSSLAEETSSVMESTSSSTQEKLMDMPAMARSVEELKTIFEKKLEAASISGESEMQVEESHSDSKKYTGGFLRGKIENDEASGKLISIEINTPVDDANKTAIKNYLQHKLDKTSSSNSQEERPNLQGKQNLLPAAEKFDDSKGKVMTHSKTGAAEDEPPVRSGGGSQNENSKDNPPSALIQEESSVQQISQIDVMKASEIYSNTSIYFSSSEDRVAKLSKARTVFQPVTLDDDVVSGSWSRDTERTENENPEGFSKCHPGPSKNLESNEKPMPNQMNKDSKPTHSKPQEQGPKLRTNHEGDHFSVGQDIQQTPADTRQKLGKEKEETEETHTNVKGLSSESRTNTNKGLDKDQLINAITKPKSRTDDASNPSETKHWLMDVIPVLSKNTRFHGFRPHKPVCVKELTEAEAAKYRQEAVKPVFRFLKRQREMEEKKD